MTDAICPNCGTDTLELCEAEITGKPVQCCEKCKEKLPIMISVEKPNPPN